MVNIAVLGYGTVGSGVVEVLFKNRESLQRKAGQALQVKYILVRRDFPGDPHTDLMVRDFNQILEDPQVQVVAEVMGGLEPAYTYTRACLERGKSVVTSNKELVAQYGAELLQIAREHHVNYLFEASVGGGIPIIHPLHLCLAANEIEEIAGILNGTTNFILTKMIQEKMSFADALALAQQLGYAERDPMWRAMTPAARPVSWPPSRLGSMSIPRMSTPKGLPRSLRRTWPMPPAAAA